MAEEQRYQEGHLLCANNCGFFGSKATMNLCSMCYRDLQEVQVTSAKITVKKSFLPLSSSYPPSNPFLIKPFEWTIEKSSAPTEEAPPAQPQAIRCTTCRKRVGLTVFRCRCGMTFCGIHRLPEKHGCSIDYKAAGREAIARSNPVVKASKINRI
ncbi:hypothetical protein KFK09_007189 [Dendrobium nobile]|uniref:Zinc finger A20 and AN1 domain-containing stress-associated protein 4 n=1 Tax=Dendrobium nobile TaxID=94219 RepID=A0A8T3BTE8_DENNO|nr:hypothetical protein KFK09_007189 [Dendrobium nobile]